MSDSERDAWLREALRHAPDADAAPPRDLSAAILAQARAASRVGGAPARAARRRNPVLALWDWLARPPVAAGFASVMAATLVGVMWWDRPMDETLPRPDVAARRSQSSPQADVGATKSGARMDDRGRLEDSRAPATTAPAAPPSASVDSVAPQSRSALQQPKAERTLDAAPANNAAKVLAPQAPPAPANTMTSEAKEPQREAAKDRARADAAAAKPSPFARSNDDRAAVAAAPAKKMDGDATDHKASDRALGAAPADALATRDAPLAKSKPAAAAPATPAEAMRAEPPSAFGQPRANEAAPPSPPHIAEEEAAQRRRAAGALSQAMPAPPATMQAAAPAAAPPPALRDRASAKAQEKQASAFSPAQSTQVPSELASAQRQGAGVPPLAPIVAAIASDPARWSRATAAGGVVALEAGWRDWLAQLDAAARGRWQAIATADERERDAGATLRLVDGGRTAAVVRLDGTTVRIDAIERGERWQATLPPAAAERLRADAERLGR